MTGYHVGRSWTGHELEDACPCPQESCGLVALPGQNNDCPQHGFTAGKTMRQAHRAEDCPGKKEES